MQQSVIEEIIGGFSSLSTFLKDLNAKYLAARQEKGKPTVDGLNIGFRDPKLVARYLRHKVAGTRMVYKKRTVLPNRHRKRDEELLSVLLDMRRKFGVAAGGGEAVPEPESESESDSGEEKKKMEEAALAVDRKQEVHLTPVEELLLSARDPETTVEEDLRAFLAIIASRPPAEEPGASVAGKVRPNVTRAELNRLVSELSQASSQVLLRRAQRIAGDDANRLAAVLDTVAQMVRREENQVRSLNQTFGELLEAARATVKKNGEELIADEEKELLQELKSFDRVTKEVEAVLAQALKDAASDLALGGVAGGDGRAVQSVTTRLGKSRLGAGLALGAGVVVGVGLIAWFLHNRGFFLTMAKRGSLDIEGRVSKPHYAKDGVMPLNSVLLRKWRNHRWGEYKPLLEHWFEQAAQVSSRWEVASEEQKKNFSDNLKTFFKEKQKEEVKDDVNETTMYQEFVLNAEPDNPFTMLGRLKVRHNRRVLLKLLQAVVKAPEHRDCYTWENREIPPQEAIGFVQRALKTYGKTPYWGQIFDLTKLRKGEVEVKFPEGIDAKQRNAIRMAVPGLLYMFDPTFEEGTPTNVAYLIVGPDNPSFHHALRSWFAICAFLPTRV